MYARTLDTIPPPAVAVEALQMKDERKRFWCRLSERERERERLLCPWDHTIILYLTLKCLSFLIPSIQCTPSVSVYSITKGVISLQLPEQLHTYTQVVVKPKELMCKLTNTEHLKTLLLVRQKTTTHEHLHILYKHTRNTLPIST